MSPDRIDPATLDDDELLVLLGHSLAATDPVPAAVVRGAIGAETWRTIDTELAELVFDSALEATGTRSATAAPAAREVTFRAGEVEIELLVGDEPGAPVEGQVVPPVGELAELASLDASGAMTAEVDPLGRFRFESVPAGPIRLGIRLPAGWVHTSWIVLRRS
jgi:hypothetical protein